MGSTNFTLKNGALPLVTTNVRFILKNIPHWLRRAVYRSEGGRISMGRHTYGSPKIRWWGEQANLTIGSFCSISDGVEIFLGGNHRVDWITTYPFTAMRQWPEAMSTAGHPATNGDVEIGSDVWLGSGCTILSGVRIGHGAVVASRAVVTRNVPDYAIVAGNPAKIIRLRFTEEQVRRLTSTAWWDWPSNEIKKRMPMLLSADIEAFLREHNASK